MKAMKENRTMALALAAVAAVAGFAAEGQVSCGVEAMTCATCRAEKRGIDVDFLVKMLSIPSETSDLETNGRCTEFLAEWLSAHGVVCNVLENDKGRKYLYASTVPGKRHDYVFVSHTDVVPAASPAQYKPKFDGDWLCARGACDTKGNVAVICQVLANLAGKGSVGALIATDEDGPTLEKGTPTPKAALEAGYVPRKFILVGDSAGEEPDQLFVAEKGHARIKLIARGKGGHSSRPWALDNPIPKLMAGWMKAMAAIPAPADPNEHWRDVISPTLLKGSDAGNQIPDTAEMTLSLRFTTPDGYDKWANFLRETTGLEVVRYATYRAPVVSDPNDPRIQALFRAMQAKWPDKNVRIGRMSAATDASYYAHLNLPTVIYAPTGIGPHSADERVSLKSLGDYADMLTAFLEAQTLPGGGMR